MIRSVRVGHASATPCLFFSSSLSPSLFLIISYCLSSFFNSLEIIDSRAHDFAREAKARIRRSRDHVFGYKSNFDRTRRRRGGREEK